MRTRWRRPGSQRRRGALEPTNNALNSTCCRQRAQRLVPANGNYVSRSGRQREVVDVLTGHQWIDARGRLRHRPDRQDAVVRRRGRPSTIPIQPSLKQDAELEGLELHVREGTGNTCDMTISNSVSVDSSLFVMGNLCFENSSAVLKAAALDSRTSTAASVTSSSAAPEQRRHGREQDQPGPVGNRLLGSHERRLDDSLHRRSRPTCTRRRSRAARSRSRRPPSTWTSGTPNANPGPSQPARPRPGRRPRSRAGPVSPNVDGEAEQQHPSVDRPDAGSASAVQYYDIPPNRTDLLGELSGTRRRRC